MKSRWQRVQRDKVLKEMSIGAIKRIEREIGYVIEGMNKMEPHSLAPEVNEWMCRVAESACANLLEINRNDNRIPISWNFKRMYRTTIPKMTGVVAFPVTYLPELKYKGHMSRYLREYYNDRIEAIKARTSYNDLSYRNDVPWEIVRRLQNIGNTCSSVQKTVRNMNKQQAQSVNDNADAEEALALIHKVMMKMFLITNEYILRRFEDGEFLCTGKYDYFKMQGNRNRVNRHGYS